LELVEPLPGFSYNEVLPIILNIEEVRYMEPSSPQTNELHDTTNIHLQDAPKITIHLQETSKMTAFLQNVIKSVTVARNTDGTETDKRTQPRRALLFIALLCVILFNTLNSGAMQFIGPQGWASVLGNNTDATTTNLLRGIQQNLHKHSAPGAKATPTITPLTPQQYINTIVQKMPLDMKLGQMMIVQFVGPDYSPDLTSMIEQYNVGAVLIFTSNQNIISKTQLKELIQRMQRNAAIPLAIATDEEGGAVNRLLKLDGPRPSAAILGATHNPAVARAAGAQDASDLASYGINLNLAPVVDVDSTYDSELHIDGRTFGRDPAQVIDMAGAYLQGLQQSGKVIGTLKHFPGIGDVSTDPHLGVPYLQRSRSDLERIDWAPYRRLIQQGHVHAIMVTHEVVTALDSQQPSTLSPKVVTGILRNELGFQGVIMTDSLTMKSITDYIPEDQAGVQAIVAGSDLLMGPGTPADVATMIANIKQAINAGTISQQRIDDSVRRILMMKYEMGLLPLPTN
jgi:beta-N-acetylhexosaminidase